MYVFPPPICSLCIDWFPKALENSEAESKELRMTISEYEAGQMELHDKLEAAFANYEREAQEKDAEIEAANLEIQKLGQQVYELEDENERLKEEWAQVREADASERERLEALTAALKEVSVFHTFFATSLT